MQTCLICCSGMTWSFAKDFHGFGLSRVEYWRCGACGFVISKTHAEMSAEEWEEHNRHCHGAYQATDSNPDDPRWQARLRSQARVLNDCIRLGLLRADGNRVDYACGDGKLSDLVATYGHRLQKYDKYMSRESAGYLADDELRSGLFDFVITTSVFEHLSSRADFDAINALVGRKGVMGVHTLVCERVPEDPSWFYLQPPHCAFHTNASMSLLFRQWGYKASIYNVDAQLWLWVRDDAGIRSIVEYANARGEGHCAYHFKEGFMDYWKQGDVTR
jgi:hypothetical protein